jgi:four helix bundle protein
VKKVESFEDLIVWQKGIALAKQIYQLTGSGPLNRDFGLRDQLQRSAISIPTNIAEGFERGSHKEYLRFLYIAKGSAGELRSLLQVAYEIGYLDEKPYLVLRADAVEISKFLSNLIKSVASLS